MSTLIVVLPPEAPGAATPLEYLLTQDGRTATVHDRAVASLLPAARETLAVVPASLLSWHRVELPKGSLGRGASPRLRAMLDGLLEDRVLDEPADLHFALPPDAKAQTPLWVAACDRAWLRAGLALLEAARRPAARIVPELAPGPAQIHLIGDPAAPLLAVRGEQGISVLPAAGAAPAWALAQTPDPETVPLFAEPALAQRAEELFARQTVLQSPADRWLQAAASAWDLAQFDLTSSGHGRRWKRATRQLSALARAPEWRAARWGLVALAAAHVAGVNAWAWKESSVLQSKREAVQAALTTSFPQVKVVVDAPLQMGREVALLRQSAGAYTPREFEALLGALGMALPPGQVPQAIEFTPGELRLRGLSLPPQEADALNAKLRAYGVRIASEGDRWALRPDGGAGQ